MRPPLPRSLFPAPVLAPTLMRPMLLALLLTLALCAGCSISQPSRYAFVAVEGPDLAVVAEQELTDAGQKPGERAWVLYSGSMERKAMVGSGKITLTQPESALVCSGAFSSPPTEKGRVRSIIKCGDGRYLFLNFSLHGPDQGAGVGRFMRMRGELPEKKKPDEQTARQGADGSASVSPGAAKRGAEASPAQEGRAAQSKTADQNKAGGQGENADQAEAENPIQPERIEVEFEQTGDAPMLLFYHPWEEEAWRRLKEVRETLERNLNREQDQDADTPRPEKDENS